MADTSVQLIDQPTQEVVPVKYVDQNDGTYAQAVSARAGQSVSVPTIVTASGNPIAGRGVFLEPPFVRAAAGATLRMRDSTTASGSDLLGGTFTFTDAYTGPLPFLKGVRFVNGVYVDISGTLQLALPWGSI